MDQLNSNQYTEMTEEEIRSQRALQARINKKLDREKIEREKHPGAIESPPLYDCSIGLSKILESISTASLFKDDRRQTFDVFMMNAWTFARNCYDKYKSTNDILRAMSKDAKLFIRYVQLYFTDQKNLIEQPYICIYLPIYNIREIYLRPLTEERRKIIECAQLFFKTSCTLPPLEHQLGGAMLYFIKVGTNYLPHKDLSNYIDRWDTGVMRPSQRRYLLISHIPLDFHLQNTLSNRLYILESYTGKIKASKDLGKKVFREDTVPFNPYTHLLFGDRVMIKPMVVRNAKKKLLTLSKEKKWNSRPMSLILNDIKSTHYVSIDMLTSMKF